MKSLNWTLAALAMLLGPAPAALAAEPNPMHPLITVLDAEGRKVRDSGRPASTAMTCAVCHDTGYIAAHDSHAALGAKVDCLACHSAEGKLPVQRAAYDEEGRLKRAFVTLGAPTAQQCAACHTVSEIPGHPLLLPEAYLQGSRPGELPAFGVTRLQGAVWSGQDMSRSGLNLQGKDGLNRPWDVHAARGLSCSDCHAPLSRGTQDTRDGGQTGHLWREPRQRSTAQGLHQPDHRLRTADCLACHTVAEAHKTLPYAQRHLDKVACQACHVPSLHAPVLQEDDRSEPAADGRSRQFWRGLEGQAGDPANARFVHAFRPFLLPYPGPDGEVKVHPVNLVLERSKEKEGLRTQVRVIPIAHGVQGGKAVLRQCMDCHGAGSRLAADLPVPGLSGSATLVDGQGRLYPAHLASLKAGPQGWIVARSAKDTLALPGQGRSAWSTLLGFLFFVLTVLGVVGHAAWRFVSRRRRGQGPAVATKRVYLYSAYERLWHWLMAFSTLLLVLTGFEVHFTAGFSLLGFATAVKAHNALAVLLLANAFLSLFYHLATSHILQFFPRRDTLKADVLAQLRYYLQGIFEGAPHPSPKGVGSKLNVLQQLTYMALLNVMLPFQAVTGGLMWAAGHWPQWSASLVLLTPLHNLGSWLFLSFTVGHVYLTTTGHTLTSNLKAMVDGYDHVEEP